MQNVILVIHVLACIAMTGVIMLQRSEGGALGIGGGGGGGGGLMTGRGAASALVRTTMIFGAIFFVTSLTLTVIANSGRDTSSLIDEVDSSDAAPVENVEDLIIDLDNDVDEDAPEEDLPLIPDVEVEEIPTVEAQPVPENDGSTNDDPPN